MNYMKELVRISFHAGFNEPMECAGMDSASESRNDDPIHLRVPEEPRDERDDFYNSTNDLWSLYESEVESSDSDKVRIKALKEDMDVILIFVRTRHIISPQWSAGFDFILISGRFILGCHHCVRCSQDSRYESKLCGSISLLPTTICSDSRSNITTTRVEQRPDLI